MIERKASVFIVDSPSDRRAAVAMAHAKSPLVGKIYLTSGIYSPGGLIAHNCQLPDDAIKVLPIRYDDPQNILKAAQELKPDLIEVGQEDAIYAGVSDFLRANGFNTFGVSRAVGRYEWDKVYARQKLTQFGAAKHLPEFKVFEDPTLGLDYIKQRFLGEDFKGRLFIKAAYPCLGKGVYGVNSVDDAEQAFLKLVTLPNQAGRTFLVEDGVGGLNAQECSGYFFGRKFVPFGYYQDHKPVFDNDLGPNTGGMGSVGPLSLITEEVDDQIKKGILTPLSLALHDESLDFEGILYFGGMYDPDTKEVWDIEFNTRNGGSEAAVNIPGIKNDYFEMTYSASLGLNLEKPIIIEQDGKFRVSVAGTSLGYPDDYQKVLGRKVYGLEDVIKREEVLVLGAAIEDDFTVSGGRIFWLVAEGDTLENAVKLVYQNMDRVLIPGDKPGENLLHFRRDIGVKELKRQTA